MVSSSNDEIAPGVSLTYVRVIADAVMSRLLLVILVLMVGTIVGVLLVKPSVDSRSGRIERSISDR
ncbi:hypothetical protein HFN76_18280 [Rhizobium laguerreae]|nr:hypothetical protein [Rhizobium laguerreae]